MESNTTKKSAVFTYRRGNKTWKDDYLHIHDSIIGVEFTDEYMRFLKNDSLQNLDPESNLKVKNELISYEIKFISEYIEDSLLYSKQEIIKRLNNHGLYLKSIYGNYLKSHSCFDGKIILRFTILYTGEIIDISILSSTTDHNDFDEKIKEHILRFCKFRKLKSNNKTTVTMSIDFSILNKFNY